MTPDRAIKINAAMVNAWLTIEGLRDGPAPNVRWFSPDEAEQASVMMRDTDIGRERRDDGGTTLRCFVAPSRVIGVYTWALLQLAEGGERG